MKGKKVKIEAEGLCLEVKKDAEGNMKKAVFVFLGDGREVRVKVHPLMFELLKSAMNEADMPCIEECDGYRIRNE